MSKMALWKRILLFGPTRLSLGGERESATFLRHENPGKNRAGTATQNCTTVTCITVKYYHKSNPCLAISVLPYIR